MMLDIRGIKKDIEYQKIQEHFEKKIKNKNRKNKINYKDWAVFKEVFLRYTKDRCPICEKKLIRNNLGKSKPTIDHYRPKNSRSNKSEVYEFLIDDSDNYILICNSCNSTKNDSFPLCENSERAKNKNEINKEKPLLVNLMKDNIFELFEIKFSLEKGRLWCKYVPKKSLLDNCKKEKAKYTINKFKLNKEDRMAIINYEQLKYYASEFDKYFKRRNYIKHISDIFKEENNEIKDSGHYLFIIQNLFHYLIPINEYKKYKLQSMLNLEEVQFINEFGVKKKEGFDKIIGRIKNDKRIDINDIKILKTLTLICLESETKNKDFHIIGKFYEISISNYKKDLFIILEIIKEIKEFKKIVFFNVEKSKSKVSEILS